MKKEHWKKPQHGRVRPWLDTGDSTGVCNALQPLLHHLPVVTVSEWQKDREGGRKTIIHWFQQRTAALTEVPFAKCKREFSFHFPRMKWKQTFPPKFQKLPSGSLALWASSSAQKESVTLSLSATGSKNANESVPPVPLICSPQTCISIPLISQGCVHLSASIFLLCFNRRFCFGGFAHSPSCQLVNPSAARGRGFQGNEDSWKSHCGK